MKKLMEILWELHPDVDFAREDRLIGKGILDSFDIVTLVAEIDEAYGISISAADLIPENFESANALYDLIRRKQEA